MDALYDTQRGSYTRASIKLGLTDIDCDRGNRYKAIAAITEYIGHLIFTRNRVILLLTLEDCSAVKLADAPVLGLAVVHREVKQVGRGHLEMLLDRAGDLLHVRLTRVDQHERWGRLLSFEDGWLPDEHLSGTLLMEKYGRVPCDRAAIERLLEGEGVNVEGHLFVPGLEGGVEGVVMLLFGTAATVAFPIENVLIVTDWFLGKGDSRKNFKEGGTGHVILQVVQLIKVELEFDLVKEQATIMLVVLETAVLLAVTCCEVL